MAVKLISSIYINTFYHLNSQYTTYFIFIIKTEMKIENPCEKVERRILNNDTVYYTVFF